MTSGAEATVNGIEELQVAHLVLAAVLKQHEVAVAMAYTARHSAKAA